MNKFVFIFVILVYAFVAHFAVEKAKLKLNTDSIRGIYRRAWYEFWVDIIVCVLLLIPLYGIIHVILKLS